jgi:hypothetical protein
LNAVLLLLVLAVIVSLNVAATIAVGRDEYSERRQKILQIAQVWLVPLFGALLVLGIHRKAEKPSGAYRPDGDSLGDDFGRMRSGTRTIVEALDDD